MFDLNIRKRFGAFELDVSGRSDARVLGVIGPSGSGKTTLLNVIAGFTEPDQARIIVGDHAMMPRSNDGAGKLSVRRRGVGYVCQDPLLFPHMSVRANVCYGFGAHGRGPSLDEVVDMLDLRPLLRQPARTLSGGEARRVAIGRAVLSAPRVMLLDEPLSGLDARLAARTLALIHRVHTTFHIPTIYVSHTNSDVVFLCDEAWRLNAGRLETCGAPREVLADSQSDDPRAWAQLRNYFLARRDDDAGEDCPVYRVGDQVLVLADARLDPRASTDTALLSVHAADIMLAREIPRRISARNILRGQVTRIDQRQGDVLVVVDVGAPWMVRITRSAMSELKLAPGVETFVIVKASAISAVPT